MEQRDLIDKLLDEADVLAQIATEVSDKSVLMLQHASNKDDLKIVRETQELAVRVSGVAAKLARIVLDLQKKE